MAEIPEQLIVEILLLLPVASLLRFRCVAKRWRRIIDSPDFVKSHLNLSNKKARPAMIFCGNSWPYYVDFDSVCNASPPPSPKQLPKPWHGDVCKFHGAVGVCNGLVCLYTVDFGLVLWNPSTGKHVQAPLPQQLLGGFVLWCLGFGYDSDSDDYKVVTIAFPKWRDNGSGRFVVWLYGFKSGSWKSMGDLPYIPLGLPRGDPPHFLLSPRQRGVFANGALHWRVRPHVERDGSTPNLIVALRLGNLQYDALPQPDCRDRDVDMRFRLGVLDGSLCATSYDYHSHDFDLWVMKEYGVKESWTKLVTCTGYTTRLTPLAYTENGSELLTVTDSNEIVRYEFKTRLFKRMSLCSSPESGKPFVCIPSLVCPRRGLCAENSLTTL